MEREPQRQVGDDSDHRRRHRGQRGAQARARAQPVDVGRAGEDPQKARREGRPQRDDGARDAPPERAAVPRGGEKADEAGDQDERSGRRFGQTQPVHHLARGQPAIGLHRVLRHVGEHGVGAAEGERGEHGKEARDLVQDAFRRHESERQERQEPDRKPQRDGARRLPGVHLNGNARLVRGLHPREPPRRCSGDDERIRQREKEDRHERRARDQPVLRPGQRPATDAQERLDHDGQHRRLDAQKERRDERDVAIEQVERGQRDHDRGAGQDEQQPRRQPAPHAVEPPAREGGELHGLRSRQQHAERQRVEKALLRQPRSRLDQLAMHQRDLRRRPAERQDADAREDQQDLSKARIRLGLAHEACSCVSPVASRAQR